MPACRGSRKPAPGSWLQPERGAAGFPAPPPPLTARPCGTRGFSWLWRPVARDGGAWSVGRALTWLGDGGTKSRLFTPLRNPASPPARTSLRDDCSPGTSPRCSLATPPPPSPGPGRGGRVAPHPRSSSVKRSPSTHVDWSRDGAAAPTSSWPGESESLSRSAFSQLVAAAAVSDRTVNGLVVVASAPYPSQVLNL